MAKGAKYEYQAFQMKSQATDTTPLAAAMAELNVFADAGWHVVATWPSVQGWGRSLILEREK